MIWQIVLLAGIVIVQQLTIFGLINRLMLMHGVSPLRLPSVKKLWHDPTPKPEKTEKLKPLFTVPLNI